MEAIRQKANNVLSNDLSMKIDFCIKSGKRNKDIDSFLKLMLDALEDVMYKNDNQIVSLEIKKHLDQEEDEIIILVEELG